MIEINLLPEETKKKKHSAPKIDVSAMSVPSFQIVSIAARSAGVILIIQLILFAIGSMSGAAFKSLALEYKDILPKKQETEKLKIRVGVMNAKVGAINELMVKRFSWEKKLNTLSAAMIPGVWLMDLNYDEKLAENVLSGYLVLSGAASNMSEEGTALIGRFMKSLKDDSAFYSDFSDIELGTIEREKMDEQEIMTFKITCFFKAKR
ncbi:MAG: hypothetical protein NTY34_02565 [Candidatus Omnitrophica bacterium]|nr:hypothetical protein [Candidatus Omnitrophota bacterium]